MTDERRTTRDSKHTHGTNPEAYPAAVDPMDRFLTQWMQIDQLRAKRDEQEREAERNRQAEQQERLIQMLAEARQSPPVTEPPLCTPRLTLHKFQEGVDEMGAFLDTFEATARVGGWPREQWTIFLRSSLSGAGLTAVASMAADQQADYNAVRAELLREYHITTETFSRRTFDTPFDSTNPDTWLSKHRQHSQQWLSSSPLDSETTMLMEVTLRQLSKWIEIQMRNLNRGVSRNCLRLL